MTPVKTPYVYKEFPKLVTNAKGKRVTVQNADEEAAAKGVPQSVPQTVNVEVETFAPVDFETRVYADGSSASGPGPLPALSPEEQEAAEEDAAAPRDANGLRLDGPTIDEFVAAGYKAEAYPPEGYAPKTPAVPAPGGELAGLATNKPLGVPIVTRSKRRAK